VRVEISIWRWRSRDGDVDGALLVGGLRLLVYGGELELRQARARVTSQLRRRICNREWPDHVIFFLDRHAEFGALHLRHENMKS
jgi:hypothetical protein